MMKIYTKTGDDGSTGLFSGLRVAKDSSAIESYGTVNELNAWLGLVISASQDTELNSVLNQIQHDLHRLCADLATPLDAKTAAERMAPEQTKRLENWIDQFEKELSPLTQFILAGGSEQAARLHIARTISRRAERRLVSHSKLQEINENTLVYLNRLSDLLFVMARLANKRLSLSDRLWDKKL